MFLEQTYQAPEGITAHLGIPPTNYDFYDLTKRGELVKVGGINYQYKGDKILSANYAGCPLYI